MAEFRRALLVGVNEYRNLDSLTGCLADVDRLKPLLARHQDGTKNFSCIVRHSTTRDSFIEDIDELLGPGADVVVLYFAGHGMGDKNDVWLCTFDGTDATPGVALSSVLANLSGSSVRECVIVLDCCFSGAAGQVPQLGSNASLLPPGVSILAASRGDQTAGEAPEGESPGGIFTTYLVAGLNGSAADLLGQVNIAGLYAHVSELFGPWGQRPMLKANVDRLHDLRRCKPDIALQELRRLPELFPRPDYEFPLDPSYEPDAQPKNREHEAIFAILQRFRGAKLVEPVGHEHMYYAAMKSLGCRLTPLGRRYRDVAELDVI
jgi:hypothetical protein